MKILRRVTDRSIMPLLCVVAVAMVLGGLGFALSEPLLRSAHGVRNASWSSHLLHSSPSIRDATLRKMRIAGYETEDQLLDCLAHTDPQIRVFAAREIRREIPFSTDSLSALQKALADDDFRVRAMAAESIGIVVRRSIGRLPRDYMQVLPGLMHAIDDTHPRVRAHSIRALGEFRDQCDFAPETLAMAMHDAEDEVRVEAAIALMRMEPHLDSDSVTVLASVIRGTSPIARERALMAVCETGTRARDCLPALIDVIEDREDTFRMMATEVVACFGPDAQPAVPSLASALDDTNIEFLSTVIATLDQLGPNAKAAIPALTNLQEREPDLYLPIERALKSINGLTGQTSHLTT